MPEKSKEGELYYFSYFKKLYESWEKSMSQALEVWLKSPIFTNSAEKAIEKSIEFKNYMHDIMERTLKHRYLPTKNDMDKLMNSLDNLEVKLNKLEGKINELQSAQKLTPERKRARSRIRRENQ
jgi:polyhydroxyalkanoate synthesis regulator phasin